jgi:hypothetical protein
MNINLSAEDVIVLIEAIKAHEKEGNHLFYSREEWTTQDGERLEKVQASLKLKFQKLEKTQNRNLVKTPTFKTFKEFNAASQFMQRFNKDKCMDMTEEQWGEWVDVLPIDEFTAMLELGIPEDKKKEENHG